MNAGVNSYFADFAASLRDRNPAAAPDGMTEKNRARFLIYRNNVFKGYVDALAAAYPVVARLVGGEFFEAMAREFYLRDAKPDLSLALYGAGFAGFIDSFPPAAGLPYLSDIARLERAWLEVYNAVDTAPLDPQELSELGEKLPGAVFDIHPAARLVASSHPIFDIWRMNRSDDQGNNGTIETVAQTVLVTRPYWDVQVAGLTPDVALFTAGLLGGLSVGAAYEGAAAQDPQFDLTAAFSQLLMSGLFTGIREGI